LGILLGKGGARFAVPVVLKLHDGIEAVEPQLQALTVVDKMAALCIEHMSPGSYALLDAYYACANVLQPFRAKGLHLITRARISTVAHAAFSALPERGRGRPRKWGSEVSLKALFELFESCQRAVVELYGQQTTVHYQSFKLFWDSPDAEVLFVLTQFPNGKQMILLSSDVTLSAVQVIEAYSKRVKIEVCFRTLVQLLGGFAYQFWLKLLEKTSHFPSNLCLEDYTSTERHKIWKKVEAFERFVNLNAIVLGVLQVLALEFPEDVLSQFPRWFRTLPNHGYPTEQIVRLTIQHQRPMFFMKSMQRLLLPKLIAQKTRLLHPPDMLELEA
jgi:hypothetical protein